MLAQFLQKSTYCTSSVGGIKHVTIIGAGLMGSGIAQVSASANYKVSLVDQKEEFLKKSEQAIEKSLQRIAKKKFPDNVKGEKAFIGEVTGRIKLYTSVDEAIQNTDLVIEAIVENLETKKSLFAKLDEKAPKNAILVSNTSSLPLGEIDKCLKRHEKFGGLHFFSPVPMMQLVEVVSLDGTSKETTQALTQFATTIGKTPVQCKDTPGFIVNRLLVPYLMEALRMAERGDASYKDIDTAMKLGAGYPMGPFELADFVGLDVNKFIIDGWHSRFPDNPLFAPSPKLNQLVKEGKLGRKTGEGFYKYGK
jgi:3-hydroxyacyl-CoA dehydrogenase